MLGLSVVPHVRVYSVIPVRLSNSSSRSLVRVAVMQTAGGGFGDRVRLAKSFYLSLPKAWRNAGASSGTRCISSTPITVRRDLSSNPSKSCHKVVILALKGLRRHVEHDPGRLDGGQL